jgi:phosphohistidine phosphatase SixA
MRMFVLHSLVFGGLVLASGCTDDGEKSWPRPTTPGSAAASSSSSASSSSGSEASSSSSSGTAGGGGMGGASSGGMGGVGGVGGLGGMGGTGGVSVSSSSSSSSSTGVGGMGGIGGMGVSSSSSSTGVGGMGGMGVSSSSSSVSSTGIGGMGGMGGGSMGPADPMNLTVVVAGQNVKIDWTKSVKPSSLILRKLGSAPTGTNDPGATIVYVGTGQTALEPLRNLLPDTPGTPRTYHYAAFGCDGTCGGTPAAATLSPTITQCLVGGGYNILWRHASADVCSDQTGLGPAANTSYPDWWKRCDNNCPMGQMATATARQLNATGMMESTAIGNSLKQKGIPFMRMITSEFCRNFTTAQLMDLIPAASLEYKPEVTYFVYDEANRCNNSMAIAATQPPAGGNTGVIGHAGFVCPTLDSLAWGEAAIYKPDGQGGSIYITRVKWNEWNALP